MKYIYTVVMMVLLSGCGGTSDEKRPAAQVEVESNVVEMELNHSYSVYEGDVLTKTSPNTKVSIVKVTQSDISTVTLLEGSAQITRAN